MARDALDTLLTECNSYVTGQASLLAAMRPDLDVALFRLAAEAQLEQLVAAVRHARTDKSPTWQTDPGE
jgi:hypothetical protein